MEARRRRRKLFDRRYVPLERRRLYILLCIIFWSILTFVLVSHFVFATVVVVGSSMSPTLQNGDRLIVERWTRYIGQPERGDVVVVHVPNATDLSVKRVVGLPGETVHIRDGRVYIDGQLLVEPYLASDMPTRARKYGEAPLMLTDDMYFLLGDNRADSEDSRFVGPLRRKAFQGKVNVGGM